MECQLFESHEVYLIQTIPISKGGREDNLVWLLMKNDMFLVRSAYHLHKELENSFVGETSCGGGQIVDWKTIWKLKIQNGIKVFIWRACKEAIPTLSKLMKRHVVEVDD